MADDTRGDDMASEETSDTATTAATPSLQSEWIPAGSVHPDTGFAHLIAVPFLVLLLDYLLFQGAGGLSFSAAFVVLPLATIAAGLRAARAVPVALFLAAFLAVAVRCAWQCGSPAILVGVLLLVTFPIALQLGRVSLPEIIASLPACCVVSAPLWLYDAFAGISRLRRDGEHSRRPAPSSTVLIPLAVCSAFAAIFLLSNPILQEHVVRWYASLEGRLTGLLARFGPSPDRIVFWGGAAFLAAILLRPIYRRFGDHSEWNADDVTPPADGGDVALQHRIALNTLIAVNALFVLYNGVDAYYLLIRDALPDGFNHSQYTHRGAFWLTVALALTTVVIGRIFHGELNFHEMRRSLMRWAALWLAQNIVLATWVFMRIHMYIDYNGMTRMRIVGIAGTTLVLVGLALVAYKAGRRKSLVWLLRNEFAAFLAACLVLAVLPMDYLAWGYNTRNILNSDPPRTSVQLTVQPVSPEGLAQLTGLLEHPDPVIAEGAAALLGRWYFGEGQRYLNADANPKRWTYYQFGQAWCARVLAAKEERILALVPDRDWDARIEALQQHTSRWI